MKISDVAQRAGVSIATVSNVINQNGKVKPDTEKKVQSIIDELGYIPNYIAKNLKKSESHTIGVIAEEITSFNTPPIIDGICECCERNGYDVSLCDLRTYSSKGFDEKVFQSSLNTLLSSRVAGLIYVGANMRDVSNLVIPKSLPTVYAYCHPSPNHYTVNYDDYQGSMAAGDYLAEHGHQRIGVISGYIDQTFVHQRMIGFQTALMNHGLTFNPAYIQIGQWNFDKARKCALELLQLPQPPTALFVMNDVMACGVLSVAAELGIRVPQELSIVGFDNRECSAVSVPKITTLKIPLREIGETSAMSLLSLLNEEKDSVPMHQLLPCELIQRESVAVLQNK